MFCFLKTLWSYSKFPMNIHIIFVTPHTCSEYKKSTHPCKSATLLWQKQGVPLKTDQGDCQEAKRRPLPQWCCFSSTGTVALIRMEGIAPNIVAQNLKASAEKSKMKRNFTFMSQHVKTQSTPQNQQKNGFKTRSRLLQFRSKSNHGSLLKRTAHRS